MYNYVYRKFYSTNSKTQLMERDLQTLEIGIIVFNYVRTMLNYVWYPQRSHRILECFIVSSVAKHCLVLSQYDLHHGSFLLVFASINVKPKGGGGGG